MALVRLLTFRSLIARPSRMLLSTFGIVLGVAAILAIGITNQTALNAVSSLFEDTSGKADLVIIHKDSSGEGISERLRSRVEEISGVTAAVPSVQVQSLLAEEAEAPGIDLSFFGTQVGGLTLYGIDPVVDIQAREYRLVEGEFLSADRKADELVLVEDYAKENDIQVGRGVEIITESGIQKFQVVGLIAKEGPGQLNNGAFGILPLDVAQEYFYRQDKYDQLDIVLDPENDTTAKKNVMKDSIQNLVGQDYSVIFPAAQGQRMSQMLGNYQIGLNFLSGMALFVGAFMIYNAFSMTVVERTREFGMLRTVGMTRAQVIRQVLGEASLMGLLGSGLGLALGIFTARGLTRMMEVMLALELANIQVPQSVVITGFVVGIIVALLAALIPALQAAGISPLEAMRVRTRTEKGWFIRYGWIPGSILLVASTVILILNPFSYDVQFRMGSMVVFSLFIGGALMIPISVNTWERALGPIVRLLFGRSGRLGSSNIQRAKLRTTLTVAALMIGVAMMVIVWVMTDSFKGDLDDWLKGYMGGDLYISSSIKMGEDVWRRLEAVEGVTAVAPVNYFEVEWKSPSGEREKVAFMALDPVSYSNVTSFLYSQTEGDPQSALRQLASGNTVFIASVLAEKYDLKPGDQVTLRTKIGERDFHIAAVVVDYYNQGLVMQGSRSDMQRYFRQKDANAFLVKVDPKYEISQIQQRIDTLYGKRDRLTIVSNQTLLESINRLMEQAFSMFDVLALIAMLVGFFGITNTLTMNVMERTQEIGMLRGVGMTRGQVILMILAEAALMGAIGGVLGLVFGVILSRIFMLAMTAMSGYTLTYILQIERVILALLIAMFVSQLAAFLPAVRAARIRILEAIQYE